MTFYLMLVAYPLFMLVGTHQIEPCPACWLQKKLKGLL